MATAKFTMQRGRMLPKDIIVTAGAAEAQSDTLSLNVDFTRWRRGDVLLALEAMIIKVQRGKDIPL
jgi:acyl-coenzyme A thioesterase PaaI-like protein